MPILGILGIVFIVLKITDYIDWSWWWVTSPFWAPLAAAGVLQIFGLALIAAVGAKR